MTASHSQDYMYSVVAKCALRLLHRVANSNVVPRRWWGRLPNAVAVAAPVRLYSTHYQYRTTS